MDDFQTLHGKISALEARHDNLENRHGNFEQAIGAIRDSQEEIAVAVGKIATSLDFAHTSYTHQNNINNTLFREIKDIKNSVSDLPSIREKIGWFMMGCGIVQAAVLCAVIGLVIIK